MPFGVYVHFPYCARRCSYCDFAITVRREIPHQRYLDAVRAELAARAPLFAGRALASIFLGGGTPSLWRADCVAAAVAAIGLAFPRRAARDGSLEVTLEANPADLTAPRLDGLRAAGVNRLSIGAQSLDAAQLVALGRNHGPDQVAGAVQRARAAGFENLSLDLIFALPRQTVAEVQQDLGGLLDLAPDHVSIYHLTIEARTRFSALARRGRLPLPTPDTQVEMYLAIDQQAQARGYQRYEISSWARPGHRAIHNSLYWSGGEWLGLGNGAHSFRRIGVAGERFATVRAVSDYLALAPGAAARSRWPGDDPLLESHEPLTAATLEREAIWLAFRRIVDGVDRIAHAARFGRDPVLAFAAEFARLDAEGLVEIAPQRARLTRRGALFADEVGARFV